MYVHQSIQSLGWVKIQIFPILNLNDLEKPNIDLMLYAGVSCTAESNHILPDFALGIKCNEIKKSCTAKCWQLNNSIKLSLWDSSNDRVICS